jgi:hypothetical protein
VLYTWGMDKTPNQTGRVFRRIDFDWHGLALHLRGHRKPLLNLVAHETYPHLYRIAYPNGWTSTAANLSRAKDAAYGHARFLLTEQSPVEAAHSSEERFDLVQ